MQQRHASHGAPLPLARPVSGAPLHTKTHKHTDARTRCTPTCRPASRSSRPTCTTETRPRDCSPRAARRRPTLRGWWRCATSTALTPTPSRSDKRLQGWLPLRADSGARSVPPPRVAGTGCVEGSKRARAAPQVATWGGPHGVGPCWRLRLPPLQMRVHPPFARSAQLPLPVTPACPTPALTTAGSTQARRLGSW